MSTGPRVVVVGGGIAGLSIAWELARGGAMVSLLRAARPPASLVAAGMLAPMPEAAHGAPFLRLAVEAFRHYPTFLAALAEDTTRDPGFVRSGVLRLASTDAEAEAIRHGVGSYEAAGMPSQWLDGRSLRREVPGIPAEALGGLLSFDEAHVQPAWLLAALAEAASSRGIEVREGMVSRVVVAGQRGATLTDPGRAKVETTAGEKLEADRVVLAAGAWTAEFGGQLLPVRPVKGQLLCFPDATGPRPIVYAGRNYIVSKADGSVLLGGTVEEAGFSSEPDERAEGLRELLPSLWPGLVGAPAVARAGLRPASPDGLPIHGPLPGSPAVYAFTGHFRNGFLLAPHGAHLAAREILAGEAQELFMPLRPRRFGEAAPG